MPGLPVKDMEVIAAVRATSPEGRKATFEACYRDQYDNVFKVSLRVGGGNQAFAEDVTHDVLIILYRRLPELDRPNEVGPWLYRVTMNEALRRLRRERSLLGRIRDAFAHETPRLSPSADELFERHEQAAAARASLDRLPPGERVVMCMKLLDDKSQQEIAEILSFSKGYVSKLVHRACARLREMGWNIDDTR